MPLFVWPAISFLAIFAAGVLLAMHERADFNADVREDTGLVREQLARRFETLVSDKVSPMRRIRRDILISNVSTAIQFEKGCQSLQHEVHFYKQMWWLDSDGVCIGASQDAESHALLGHPLGEQPGWEAVTAAVKSGHDSMALLSPDQPSPRQVAVLPIRRDDDQMLIGFVACRIDFAMPMHTAIDERTYSHFDLEVRDAADNVVLAPHTHNQRPIEFSVSDPIPALDSAWHISIWPLPPFVAQKTHRAEWIALWASVILGFAVACGVWQAIVHQRRNFAYKSALEALSDVTAAIAQAPEKGREVLARLTQIAADLLGMPICVFSRWEENTELFHVIYCQGLDGHGRKESYSWAELPATREAFRKGKPVYASDIWKNPGCFDREASEKHNIRSSIIIPLQLRDRPVGVIALSDFRPRKFSKSDLRLANLWGSQAAVTVVNSELHLQTQHDAHAKVELLRELNHRVKNNLAGIAGLLSMYPTELPEDVRRWLDRVIQRVDGMARVHKLLMDGAQSMAIPDVVGKAVESATVLWPAGVRLSLDLHGGQISLPTNRAVTLAMVLHELLFNALRHGVSDHGEVWVSSKVEEQYVIIDVIDDASQNKNDDSSLTASYGRSDATAILDPPAIRAAGQTGLGLQLVQGLVGRELQGSFSFVTLSDGRTRARVVFSATG